LGGATIIGAGFRSVRTSRATVTVINHGVLNIVSGNDHNMPNCTLTNYGTMAWSDGAIRGGGNAGTLIHNLGLWDAQSDHVFNDDFDAAGVQFYNASMFRKSAGLGTTALLNGVVFNNPGTSEAE